MSDAPHGSQPPTANEEGLDRSLGLFSTTMLVMGAIIGAGIFFAPYKVAQQQTSTSGILLTWALGGVLALTGAIVFAELGGLFPKTGGQYIYLRRAYGRTISFIFGWTLIGIVNSGAVAVVASIAAMNLDLVLSAITGSEQALGEVGQKIFAVALIVSLTWVNVRGIRLGATIHNFFMVLKIACVLFVIALGLVYALGGGEPRSVAPKDAPFLAWNRVGLGLLGVLFTYGGWNNAASVSGEIKDVQRVLPRAVLIGTVSIVALYVGLNLALIALLGPPALAEEASPVAAAAGVVLGQGGSAVIAGMIVLSTIGVTHALLLLAPRVFLTMAREGDFLAPFGAVHKRYATPHVAILALAGFTLFHMTQPAGDVLDALVIFDWIFFSLTAIAFFVFRFRHPEMHRPYRATGYPVVPLVFLVLSCWVVLETASAVTKAKIEILYLPIGIFLGGFTLYLWSRWREARA